MTDREIERCARALIDRHGPEARATAEARAGQADRQGDRESGAEWRRIAARVRELRARTIPSSFC